MFDQQATTTDVDEWSDERYDAWVADLIAADPGDPTADLLPGREVSRDPVLDAIDAMTMRNLADGRVAMAVAELLRTTSPRECLSAPTLVAAEIGPALSLGSGAAMKLVDAVIALTSRLHATYAAVCAGDLAWDKAAALAEWTGALSDEQALAVEERVLPGAARRTPAQHRDALRRAVNQVDPDGAAARRRQAKADVALIRSHYGDGMGELFARMASEQLDTVWTAADLWARSRKADGDARTLDQLRVVALVQWAQSLLHHGDPTYCDRWCAPGSHGTARSQSDREQQPRAQPTRHGRPGALHALWDLRSLIGLTNSCGELADSGAGAAAGCDAGTRGGWSAAATHAHRRRHRRAARPHTDVLEAGADRSNRPRRAGGVERHRRRRNLASDPGRDRGPCAA